MKNYLKIYLTLLLLNAQNYKAQNEFSKWFFGYQASLDFLTTPPSNIPGNIGNSMTGVASIADANGNLLFYTNGVYVVNSNHVFMANGLGLAGDNSSAQSGTIVKKPGSSNLYYIFTAQGGGILGYNYSIVDMNLAAGLGSVTVKNAPLYTPTAQHQVAVRHCNGRDVWLVSHAFNSNEFRAYLLDPTGVSSAAVVSAIGQTLTGNGYIAMGHLKISPDGRKLAMTTASNAMPASSGTGGFHLFDFDAATGIVSNSLTLVSGEKGAFGIEFSSDGTKLFGTVGAVTATLGLNGKIFQWNVCASSPTAITTSQYSIDLGTSFPFGMQRAIDGKIYITVFGTESLSVIHNPNQTGAAINFSLNNLFLGTGKQGRQGLPNFINPYTKPPVPPINSTVACQSVAFNVPPAATFSSGCSSTPYTYSAYLWDFGEPASAAANTSTVHNPSHTYAALGTYTATLIMYSNCTNDTIQQVINITANNPPVNVAGLFSICKGDVRTYTASGGITYQWNNGSITTPTLSLAPTVTSVYSVTGTADGCKATEVFTVTVNACAGVSSFSKDASVSVFPNPFNDNIFVEATSKGILLILDVNGKKVLESNFISGHNEINTQHLPAGLYTLQTAGEEGVWRGKMVKVQ